MDFTTSDLIGENIVIVDRQTGASRRFSSSDATRQNTVGLSEGFPAGVPTSYSWYRGRNDEGHKRPPAGFTAVTGWGQVYNEVGHSSDANAYAAVEIANARTYV